MDFLWALQMRVLYSWALCPLSLEISYKVENRKQWMTTIGALE